MTTEPRTAHGPGATAPGTGGPCTGLRVEHLGAGARGGPVVVGADHPRLSWLAPAGSVAQLAWQVRATLRAAHPQGPHELFESGWATSPERSLVQFPGPLPEPGGTVDWQVRVRTDLGVSPWSDPHRWVRALDPGVWTTRWVEPVETPRADGGPGPGARPAHLLRGAFTLDEVPVRAVLRVTAHGLHETHLNGVRVGDAQLTPGFTAYRSRLQVHTYEVTDLVRPGDNLLGAVLSDGWFRGRHGFLRDADGYGTRVGLLAELVLHLPGGRTVTTGTGAGWCSTPAWFTADLMDGQVEDRRLAHRLHGWCVPGAPADGPAPWTPVRLLPAPADGPARGRTPTGATDTDGTDEAALHARADRLTTPCAPEVGRVREVAPARLTHPADGSTVADFGENLNGWVRLRVPGPAGTRLRLVHGEKLDAAGAVTTGHLRAVDIRGGGGLLPAGQVDEVVSAGVPDDVFEPRHTTHGFRYVQVHGAGRPLAADDLRAVVVHTRLRATGTFDCSDPRLVRLHEAAVRTFLANACDVPTDCPQRERSGFTGDWQVYVASAACTHDVAGFSQKWLADLVADQWPDGTVPNVVPDPAGPGHGASPLAGTNGSAGWGDAVVLVPWQLWRAYGDLELLRSTYPAMRAWVERCAGVAATHRHPTRAQARPTPAEHERWLWDTGFHFGEWLEPGEPPRLDPHADHGVVATAYLHLSARRLADVARLLGHEADRARFTALADGAARAWRAEYLAPDGTVTHPTQATLVRALAFGLVPEPLRPVVAQALADRVRADGTRLGTGFLTTGLLLPTLADTGHADLAHEVLTSTGVPSWLEMLERGATTLWEDWNGVDEHGVATLSLNHYSKGAVLEFLHTHVAGLRPGDGADPTAAGYRTFEVRPVPGPLAWARATHDTPYGTVHVAWERVDGPDATTGPVRVRVQVPPGCTALLHLPDGTGHTLGPGVHTRTEAAPARTAGGAATLGA